MIMIPRIHGQASLVVSKSIILFVRYNEFPKIIKTFSIFWSLIFQNPVLNDGPYKGGPYKMIMHIVLLHLNECLMTSFKTQDIEC